ncbi:efflux RND transporter periplasmic adaptor subunit [Virgibacillus dakarensis]|uniref:efflux RND transporter periplasmic adaptor subunit n=1 Tax=Virgibacillus dakarensis TaxID=1917889 RepID=UPI000B4511D3|nr:efflux RND transporter periplasmic adaptor subunit [Virgibacillus dakarensis]MTW87602.1 efflux RND transporter periplasmic adaptor subunit [Virgibacillus dakarensis]
MKRTLLAALAVVVIGLLTACNQDDKENKEAKETVTPVETAKVEQGDFVIEKSIYGRTAPASSTPIMVPNPGEITALEVENGDTVDKGDLIATISGGQNIYAAKAGEIANLTAEEGSLVSNEDPIAVIADFDTLKIQLTVTSDELNLFEKEAKHNATIDGNEGKAEITSIAKLPNDTGLYPVEATIDNENEEMLPGEVATLYVPEKKVKDTLIVPTAAIVEEGGESFVYVVKDGKVVKTDVKVKEGQSDKTAIEGELKKGAEVVTSGQLTLEDGSKVNVVKAGNQS